MKFLVDAQLPPALATWLAAQGHEATSVHPRAKDSPIWNDALQHGAIIVSKDEDFAVRRKNARSGPVVVWLRVGNCSRRALMSWFSPLFPEIVRRIENGETLIEVR